MWMVEWWWRHKIEVTIWTKSSKAFEIEWEGSYFLIWVLRLPLNYPKGVYLLEKMSCAQLATNHGKLFGSNSFRMAAWPLFWTCFWTTGRPQDEWKITKRHLKIGFDEFEWGIIKIRVLEGQTEENEDWAVGHPIVFPTMLRVGESGAHSFQIRVPMDDENTLHFWYTCFVPKEGVQVPEEYPISFYECPIKDENGKFVVNYIDGQEMMAWITQGRIANRTTERLGYCQE